jgi:hypothetical protein
MTDVAPRGAGIGRFRDADRRAVYPRHARQVRHVRAAVRVEHPPAFDTRIPDRDWIGRTVEDRIAKERLRRDEELFVGATCQCSAQGQKHRERDAKRSHRYFVPS